MILKERKIQKIIKKNAKENHKILNCIYAFIYGGMIAIFSQLFFEIFTKKLNIDTTNASVLTSGIIIFISFVLTCFGVFDSFALIAKAGASIPISGFANSITSSALEGKAEGLIFGIGGKMFSLIGSVCTYGIVSSIILGFIYFLTKVIKWKVKVLILKMFILIQLV